MIPYASAVVAASGAVGEDRAAVIPCGSLTVVVVADGAGGTGGGAAAADLVLERVRGAARDPMPPAAWCELLVAIDAALLPVGQAAAVVLAISDTDVVGASVGDAGARLVAAEAVVDLTAQQRRKPLLGSGAAAPVSFATHWSGGTLVVATDGLFKYAPTPRIAEVVRRAALASVPAELVDLVRLRSGALHDDVAVVVARR